MLIELKKTIVAQNSPKSKILVSVLKNTRAHSFTVFRSQAKNYYLQSNLYHKQPEKTFEESEPLACDANWTVFKAFYLFKTDKSIH